MTNRYLVLSLTGGVDTNFGVALRAGARNLRGRPPPQLTLSVENASTRDAGELRADPKNAAVMDADAVFSLLRPKARAALDAGKLEASLTTVDGVRVPRGLLAVGAHASTLTGRDVTVAVLDTGIDAMHPAFAGKKIAAKNFTRDGAVDDVTDIDGHGTHCAGTVCGGGVDGVRVGVAPGVEKLAIGKVLGRAGGSLEMFLKGMLWAVLEQKANVVSMSLGFDLPGNVARMVERGMSPALAAQAAMQLQNDIIKGVATLRAFLESQARNVVFVAATGNESERSNGFVLGAGLPAAELFAVGAVGATTDADDKWEVADFSNGRALVVAPGIDVVSARVGGGWELMSGTSMATPHAAGVAALWVEHLHRSGQLALPDAVRTALRNRARRDVIVGTDIDATGAGMIQAPMAYMRDL